MYYYILLLRVLLFYNLLILSCQEKRRFIFEYPVVTFRHPKYVGKFAWINRRYSRNDPTYYSTVIAEPLMPLDNNLSCHYYFYEYVSNTYRHTFLEFHIKWCDFLNNDIFGKGIKESYLQIPRDQRPTSSLTCPTPPGVYTIANFTIPTAIIPSSIMFQKGRLYANSSYKGENILAGYIEFNVKEARRNDKKAKPKLIH